MKKKVIWDDECKFFEVGSRSFICHIVGRLGKKEQLQEVESIWFEKNNIWDIEIWCQELILFQIDFVF